MKTDFDIVIIGGGAAGFFTAINAAQFDENLSIAILERGKEVLSKVKVSGGGRCNVTHAEFLPDELVSHYPRGEKELLGPFHRFMTGDTVVWFEERGVNLKIEDDGRMFPVTDNSQTIIDCFISEAERLHVEILKGVSVKDVRKLESGWQVYTNKEIYLADKVVIATGSNPKIWSVLENLGHTIVSPVASLFTFNIKDPRISDLAGISTHAYVEVLDKGGNTVLNSDGPLLITHWGMSGPAILKLSAWGARILAPLEYKFIIRVNWLPNYNEDELRVKLKSLKESDARKQVPTSNALGLPKRLWKKLVIAAGIEEKTVWADLNREQLRGLAEQLVAAKFEVSGKSTFKEEFVTAGGVELKEVNFKTFESRLHPGLYFAGEVLNIDAITGGFNFQNAWTGGYMVAQAIVQ